MSIILDGTTGITTPGLTNTGTETILNLTTTGNTILGDATTDTLNVGAGGLVKDASGNVGIGTTSPSVSGVHISRATGSATPTPVELRLATTTSASDWSTTDPWGRISFYSADASSGGAKVQAAIQITATGTAGGVSALTLNVTDNATGTLYEGIKLAPAGTNTTYTTFSTSGSERMRLDSSGNLGLGVTPSAWFSSGYKTFQNGWASFFAGASNTSSGTFGYNTYTDTSGVSRYIGSSYATFYEQYQGQHAWYKAPSGTAGDAISFTQAMTLDASGNLGVATTSPSTYTAKIVAYAPSSYAPLALDGASGVNTGINFYTNGTIRWTTQALSDGSGFRWYDFVASAERMRIDSSGNLLVGTTTAGLSNTTGFNVTYASGSTYCSVGHVSGTGAGQPWLAFAYNGSAIGSITQSGTTATSYNTSSDYRLKENIAPMTGALAKVAELKPVTYTWKVDGSSGQGFIAHELAEVFPEAVVGEKDATETVDIKDEEGNVTGQETKPVYQGIDTSFLVATLTAAIQELKAEFDAYKATHP